MSGSPIWGNDTINTPGCDYAIVSFDTNGEMEWFAGLRGINFSTGFIPTSAVLANDDEGHVWMTILANDTLIIANDTVPCPNWLNRDHVLLRFGPDGTLLQYLVIPNSGGTYSGPNCMGLVPAENGSVLWCGRFSNQMNLGGQQLSSTTDRGLLVQFDEELYPVRFASPEGFGPNGFTSMAHDPSNNGIVLAGHCKSNFQFGDLSLTSNHSNNAFLAFLSDDWQVLRILKLAGQPNITYSYLHVSDVHATAGAVHAITKVGPMTTLPDGTTVGNGAVTTRVERENAVSVETVAEAPFGLWPNPVDYTLNVELGGNNKNGSSISVLSIDGRVVREEESVGGTSMVQVDCSSLSAGQYFLRVANPEGTRTFPFIRQ
ncbi:MAG: T9SS type A sorting domain-containing protein [Flavobacteriales bacterium]